MTKAKSRPRGRRSSSPPTSPPGASTSMTSRTSSTSNCRTSPRPTSTASAAPAGQAERERPSASATRRNGCGCGRSSGSCSGRSRRGTPRRPEPTTTSPRPRPVRSGRHAVATAAAAREAISPVVRARTTPGSKGEAVAEEAGAADRVARRPRPAAPSRRRQSQHQCRPPAPRLAPEVPSATVASSAATAAGCRRTAIGCGGTRADSRRPHDPLYGPRASVGHRPFAPTCRRESARRRSRVSMR